jgi:hypothetical protein
VVHLHNISLMGGAGLLALDVPGAVRLMTVHEHWLTCPLSVRGRFNREPCLEQACVRCTVRAGRPPQWWRMADTMPASFRDVPVAIFPSTAALEAHRERGFAHPNALPASWGLGWALRAPQFGDLVSPATFGHLGATGTIEWADPASRCVFVLLTNQPRLWDKGGSLFARFSNAVAAACLTDRVPWGRTVLVHLPGGDLKVTAPGPDRPVLIEGPVRRVFEGTFIVRHLVPGPRESQF